MGAATYFPKRKKREAKPLKCGAKVETLDALIEASKEKRSVVYEECGYKRRAPAAFVQNRPAIVVYWMLRGGVYIYEKS